MSPTPNPTVVTPWIMCARDFQGNRSLDDLLGHLYGPNDARISRASLVVAEQSGTRWAELPPRTVPGRVPVHVGTDMGAEPDSGRYYHTKRNSFGTIDDPIALPAPTR